MKNYAVLEEMQKTVLDDAFNKCYEQGYQDGKKEVAAELNFEKGYYEGYKDGKTDIVTKAKAEVSQYREDYDKGLKHGQELRAEEVKCAEACGMKRAWNAAKKILSRHGEGYDATDREVFGTDDVFSLSASEAVSKLEAWEKKQKQEQEQSKKRCENCDHYCGYDNKFKCDINGVLCIERDRWTPKQDAPDIDGSMWQDIPTEEMTLEQARAAVKELRKEFSKKINESDRN